MSFVFKLLFVFGVALMVIASDEIVDNQEIEALQKKLCDNDIPKEAKDRMIDCMEENLPFEVLAAMDSCVYEAMPTALTRDQIQKSLCSSANNRAKVHTCMLDKQKRMDKALDKEEVRNKFNRYKSCIDSALIQNQ